MFEYLDKIREWAPVGVDLLILLVGACTALQALFLFLGKWFPACATIAHWLGIAALDIKQAADGVSKLLGKGKDAAKAGTVAIVALLLSGCAGSFEEARIAGAGPHLKATPLSPHCESLDATHRTWGGVAKFSGALAGVSGLAAIPVDEKDARIALASGAAAAGAIAVTSVFISEDAASSFVRDCQ
jgi:hypothetical protein